MHAIRNCGTIGYNITIGCYDNICTWSLLEKIRNAIMIVSCGLQAALSVLSFPITNKVIALSIGVSIPTMALVTVAFVLNSMFWQARKIEKYESAVNF